jgi:homocysteine S-methyltransferase
VLRGRPGHDDVRRTVGPVRGFAAAVSAGGLVADGGLATELEARGHDLSDRLWSARLLRDDPGAITGVHRAYFAAGAVVATGASYQASFEGFGAEAGRLLRRSVELARAARDEVAGDGRPRWVAASVGPYGAVLADGSEYRGRYGRTVPQLAAWHRPRLEALAAAGPDVLALETIPDLDEAQALAGLLPGLGVPAWLSYTVAGGRTRAGQPLAEAFALAAGVPEIVAVGVNCCDPADVPAALALARPAAGKPVLAYPNSGEGWQGGAWTGPSRFDPVAAAGWGAELAGGCCRVGPAGIEALVRAAR